MKILIALNHPAHYYLFKFISKELVKCGNEVKYVIKGKDILEKILIREGVDYTKLINSKRNKLGKLSAMSELGVEMVKQDYALFQYLKLFRPDIMIGTDISITHIGSLKGIPSLVFNEDDIEINKLFCYSAYPFAKQILTPVVCNTGLFMKKRIDYDGYQKLAYLHPNWFKPDKDIVRKYFRNDNPYFLLRLVSFTAGHDIEKKHSGISLQTLGKLISVLKQKGDVYITAEKDLPVEFKQFELLIDPVDIHHLMFFSELFIGDSQSMIVEAAMLGTPSVRFNSFVGKISVLNELENKFNLTIGVQNNNPQLLLDTVKNLITTKNLRGIYHMRRKKMISEKIDVTAFIVWFIDNYPGSVKIVKENSDFQYRFK